VETTEHRIATEDWPGAVADSDGYQMIVAGPGTGKTEFLVRRVEHIIDSDKAGRDEVVLLCFSRRAAGELRLRVEDRIGVTGLPVDVTTFHSLALRLLEGTGDGDPPSVLTTPEQVGVVADLLSEEDPEAWPLLYRGILTTPAFAAEVADFLMRCSERLLGPEELAQLASERADWRGLPEFFSRYLDRLESLGKTDYGALLTSAVGLLGTEEGRRLSDIYRYILVDEYQDTTPAHARMADLLADPHGNLTVTGDPYQSIYSFRGSELRNVASFSTAHPEARRQVLTQSFRVPARILETAVRVVSSGELPGEAGPVEPAPGEGVVEAYVFDQETAEAEWIATEVEETIRVGKVSPPSIAVLVRSKRELLSELSRGLHRRGVPHDPPRRRLVDHPAVVLIRDLVTVSMSGGALPSVAPSEAADADRAMRRILLGPLFALTVRKERELLRMRRNTWGAWSQVISSGLVDHPGLTSLVGDDRWAAGTGAAEGFWHAWTTLDGIGAMVDDPRRQGWRRALASFAQALDRQTLRDPGMTLARYFELTDEEGFEADPLISPETTPPGVALTTLHQAKGLEFEVVFIANAVEGVFPDLRRSRRMLRPELLSPERTVDPHAQHLFQLQEEMRLAYTAMTRARRRVVWTATDAGVDQGEHRPSRFLLAAAGTTKVPGPPKEPERDPITIGEAEIWLRRALVDPSAPSARRLAAARVLGSPSHPWWDPARFAGIAAEGPNSPILDGDIRLSPSQADTYKTCPRLYALERRLRLGDASSPYALFGSLIHEVLERAEREAIGTGERHASLETALAHLKRVWAEGADFGSEALDAAWLGKAEDLIVKLYENWPGRGVPIQVEEKVEAVIEQVIWRGRVDRVEETGEGLVVVDYKTSSRAPTKEEAAESLQLGFYAAALGTDRPVVAAEMWFPRLKTQTVSKRSLDLDRLDDMRRQMAAVTAAIRAERWEPTPGSHCQRCQFRLSCPAWPEGRGAFLP
jgi:superfamily I DNA/RNA helicase/RecB family exonuclease